MISGSVVKIEGQSNTNAKMINANRAAIDYLEQKVNKGCQLENEKQSYQRNQELQDKCQQLQEEKQMLEKKLAERQASQTTPLSDSNEERNMKHYSFQGKGFLPYK
jgi:predicted RNase H-like nuclease (RuvC/YqgF family)